MADVVEAVAARIESVLGSARVVYRHAVPDSPAARYVVVRGSVGETSSQNFSDLADQRTPIVWVTSSSHSDAAETAAREVAWAQSRVVDALTDWRPALGRATWKAQHLISQPTQRDDSLPDHVVFAVDQYLIQYQP